MACRFNGGRWRRKTILVICLIIGMFRIRHLGGCDGWQCRTRSSGARTARRVAAHVALRELEGSFRTGNSCACNKHDMSRFLQQHKGPSPNCSYHSSPKQAVMPTLFKKNHQAVRITIRDATARSCEIIETKLEPRKPQRPRRNTNRVL